MALPDSRTAPATEGFRRDDIRRLLGHLSTAQCVNLVGVSNIGKSILVRELCGQEANSRNTAEAGALQCIYIDCNRMLDWTEQAFYELVLRVLAERLESEGHPLAGEFRQSHEAMLQPAGDLQRPLTFDRALTGLLEVTDRPFALVMDEFDAPFVHLEPRVFLNLRALKDRFSATLVYLTVTDRSLPRLRSGEQVDEFTELFAEPAHYLLPLSPDETLRLVAEHGRMSGGHLDSTDAAFVLRLAGGHPALIGIVCRRLLAAASKAERSATETSIIHRQLEDDLRTDASVRAECEKIWRDLDETEQAELSGVFQPAGMHDPRAFTELVRKGLLTGNRQEPQFFAYLFRRFVQHMNAAQRLPEQGLRVDVELGEVRVDGEIVETLTGSEYRLLLLLYGHLNKICDKYQIVASVWGEDYVDEVYDASIDKLISRLRHKIEPDPGNPQYLLTIRGRGYKLVG